MTQTCNPPATPKQAARRRGSLDRALDPDVFKALSDPTRARLLACLAKCARPCTVSELAACCDVDLSVVSRHLAQLARAGLLDSDRSGRTVRYTARSAELAARFRALAAAFDECCPGLPGCCDKETDLDCC